MVLRILNIDELAAITWPPADPAAGGRELKMVHFPTGIAEPSCKILQFLTPSSASSLAAEVNAGRWEHFSKNVRFYVASAGTLTEALREQVVRAARPAHVLADPATYDPDLAAGLRNNVRLIWMGKEDPPTDWISQAISELNKQ